MKIILAVAGVSFAAFSVPLFGSGSTGATAAHVLALHILRTKPDSAPAEPPSAAQVSDADRSNELLKRLPKQWSETRTLNAANPALHAAARRTGEDWFVGSCNGGKSQTWSIDFGFLDPGRKYAVHLFEDHPGNGPARGTRYSVRLVTSADKQDFALRAHGGVAMWITPDSKRR